MPEARVPCESCPWPARGKRPAAASMADDVKREAAQGIAQDCREDGGTCYGAVRWCMSADADPWREPEPAPAVARQQVPETPDHTVDRITPTTAVDFVSAPQSED